MVSTPFAIPPYITPPIQPVERSLAYISFIENVRAHLNPTYMMVGKGGNTADLISGTESLGTNVAHGGFDKYGNQLIDMRATGTYNNALNIDAFGDPYSVVVRVRLDVWHLGTQRSFFRVWGSADNDCRVYVTSTGHLYFLRKAGGVTRTINSAQASTPDNTWRTIVLTTSDTDSNLYIDGVNVATRTDASQPFTVSNWVTHVIGAQDIVGNEHLNGDIAYAAYMHNVELTPTQITELQAIG